MARALILTASYGSGHNTAAQSLATAFVREGVSALIVDHFHELVNPIFERASRGFYYQMLRYTPLMWGVVYEFADRMASDSRGTFGATGLGLEQLAHLLDAQRPDFVVTVHPTPAVVMSMLAQAGRRVPPHTTVVTDFVAHSQWIASCIDRYCVAADEVRNEYIARGIPPERVIVTGVPLRPEFEDTVDTAAARVAFGLSATTPVVLAMAGSHGTFGRLPDIARSLLASPRPLQGLLITGTDEALAGRMERMTAGTTVRTLGHVKDIRRLMAAADLIVTKAGGMTIAEAMAAGLPVLCYGSLPGQERRNELFASRAGIALVARSRRELAHLLDRALTQPPLLERLRERMQALKRPDASRRIVSAILERDGSRV